MNALSLSLPALVSLVLAAIQLGACVRTNRPAPLATAPVPAAAELSSIQGAIEEPEPVQVVARLVKLEYGAHEEWLNDGRVLVSNVMWLEVYLPEVLKELVVIGVRGHPMIGDRPVLLGRYITFEAPANWLSRELELEHLEGLAFYRHPEASD